MFEFLKGKTAVKPGQIGLAYEGNEMAMVWASAEGSTAKLNHWEWLTNQERGLEQALLDRVTTLELENMPCNVALDASLYRLLLLEAPNVEADELPQALRFLLRDIIDLPLDEIEITTFPVPEDAYPCQGKMVYAIAVISQGRAGTGDYGWVIWIRNHDGARDGTGVVLAIVDDVGHGAVAVVRVGTFGVLPR